MNGLLRGEIYLTAEIITGLILAEVILRLRLPDIIMKRFAPKNIPPVTALAVAVSAGSSKAGAAIISSSLSRGEITERSAVWSVLMLPLPSYLRRWPSTFALSLSMAGKAGGIFAASLLARSIIRFMIALKFLRRENPYDLSQNQNANSFPQIKNHITFHTLKKTLPVAWIFFAVSYSIVPFANEFMRNIFADGKTFLPLSGWAVSAASIGHVSAALSLAGGAIEAGELSVSQGVFALILGSGLGTATRILRQNAGYYYGLFPKGTATKMLMMNLATIIPLIMINLIFAGLALSLWP